MGQQTFTLPIEGFGMSRKRTPLAVAKATGAHLAHPGRYADRRQPRTEALEGPPDKLTPKEAEAWREIVSEMPWLGRSDRAITEMAARLSVRVQEPDCPIGVYAQLRLCLTAMGGTPVDRQRVGEGDDDGEDPSDEFLQ
jgi:hypothetical protein